ITYACSLCTDFLFPLKTEIVQNGFGTTHFKASRRPTGQIFEMFNFSFIPVASEKLFPLKRSIKNLQAKYPQFDVLSFWCTTLFFFSLRTVSGRRHFLWWHGLPKLSHHSNSGPDLAST